VTDSPLSSAGAGSRSGFAPVRRLGSFLVTSGLIARDGLPAPIDGDVRAQTRIVLDRLGVLLADAGSSLARIAAVQVYLRNPADFAAMNSVYATYFTDAPPTRTTVAADLRDPHALVEIAVVAVPDGAPRDVIHPAGWPKSPNPYSYGIRSGDTVFLSGLLARDPITHTPIDGDTAAQTLALLDHGQAILEAAGLDLGDVVSTRAYITDAGDFDAMNTAYRARFLAPMPVRATVRTGLMSPAYAVEMTLTAVDGERQIVSAVPSVDGMTVERPSPNLSAAVITRDRVFLSGLLGAPETHPGELVAQTRDMCAQVGRTLAAAGADWSRVGEVLLYVTDMRARDLALEQLSSVLPLSSVAGVTVGTGLLAPGGVIELMVTAARG